MDEEQSKEVPLNSTFAIEFSGKESPSELFCQEQGITCIGELGDVTSLRKLDLSFNPLTSLDKIQQLNQLRHLSAYCCRLTDIECLCGLKRLETLFLQQNGISSIPFGNSFHKLRELRLDRNQISDLGTLSSCSNLRSLNLSWNSITSLEGLGGLQNLQEIDVSHNRLGSLKHLRALPSLVELNVSYNSLKNLDGLQLLPTIEVLHAECNAIATIAIPKTYFSHLHKDLDKKGGGSNTAATGGAKKAGGRGGAGSVAESSHTGGLSRHTPSMSTRAPSEAGRGGRKESRASEASSRNKSTEQTVSTTSDTIVGLQSLSEIYLNGNHIQTLSGLEAYGVNLDTLDISDNEIADSEGTILFHLSKLKKLNDLRIMGNRIPPGTINDTSSGSSATLLSLHDSQDGTTPTFEELLRRVCPVLCDVDGRPIQRKGTGKAARNDPAGFHTWEDGSISVVDPPNVGDDEEAERNEKETAEDEPLSDDEEFLRQAEQDAAEEYKKKNPILVIETMLTREEIIEKETIFRYASGLLSHTKERIVEAVRSFVPVELRECGFDIDGLDLKKSTAATSASRDQKPSGAATSDMARKAKAANEQVSRQNSARVRTKKAVLASADDQTRTADDDASAGTGGRPSSHDEGRSRPGSDISRARILRTAVSSISREAGAVVDRGTVPRIIGATHVEATKKKNMIGRPPIGLDTRVKRGALGSPQDRAVQSARLADDAKAVDDKPSSARSESNHLSRVRAAYTERSSSFTCGDRRDITSTSTVRVVKTARNAESEGSEIAEHPSALHMLDSNDGDSQSIQWAPLSSTEISAAAPGEYVSERYAAALKEGLASMESESSGIEWREMLLNEDIQGWDDESVNELQEMYSPRYEHVAAASKVPPPKSKSGGKELKAFRVPSLGSGPGTNVAADGGEEK